MLILNNKTTETENSYKNYMIIENDILNDFSSLKRTLHKLLTEEISNEENSALTTFAYKIIEGIKETINQANLIFMDTAYVINPETDEKKEVLVGEFFSRVFNIEIFLDNIIINNMAIVAQQFPDQFIQQNNLKTRFPQINFDSMPVQEKIGFLINILPQLLQDLKREISMKQKEEIEKIINDLKNKKEENNSNNKKNEETKTEK